MNPKNTDGILRESPEAIKEQVRDRYGEIARKRSGCCGAVSSCCGVSDRVGYRAEDLEQLPAGADLGLGCGNPTALDEIRSGETVLDLGSGAGIDAFLAARKVGPEGRVIGVDMTTDMILRARQNAAKGGHTNIEFVQAEIERLPLADQSVDVVLSNCVINLSPDKGQVFAEAFRVLRAGGRMMISDIVLARPLPPAWEKSVHAYVGCVAGAQLKDEYLDLIRQAGFREVQLLKEVSYSTLFNEQDPFLLQAIQEIGATLAQAREVLSSILSISVKMLK